MDPQELAGRRRRLFTDLAAEDVAAIVLFGPTSVLYLTGFFFIPTERPIGIVLAPDRTLALVPRLEAEHVQESAAVDEVIVYEEYPGPEHPMRILAQALAALPALGRHTLGVDADGYPPRYGYRGPALSELLPNRQVRVGELVERHRLVKSAREQHLLRVSSRFADLAHRHLQDLSRDGANEVAVSSEASERGARDMIAALGREFDPKSGGNPLATGFRGQIGPNSALPHAVNQNLVLRRGDVLVTGASSAVWGYHCELERTMFVGEPSTEQRRWFELMLGAQDLALRTIRPGATCADVDRAVRAYCAEQAVMDAWRHHVGHGLGMEVHEAPFLDVGDERVLEPGMVLSVEPGLYVPGLGGFRHSDTVAVTEQGCELFTRYPRDLDSLIC
ncbi:MAG: aminopeptidase P family protein, partial [Candidatus Dormibacteraeota bacterium]|nr:aminopeptidase P family protein [Candidatus Dormibacteraeota bacterium]